MSNIHNRTPKSSILFTVICTGDIEQTRFSEKIEPNISRNDCERGRRRRPR